MFASSLNDPTVASTLIRGGLIIAKTDTIYGILAKANLPKAVNKVYRAKHRNKLKACIILVSDVNDIPGLQKQHKQIYLELSKGRPTTIIVPVGRNFLPHLVRQNDTLAFRLVGQSDLAKLIDQVGPLVAPSANPEGEVPATNIEEAVTYFGALIDVYVDSGDIKESTPSKIIAINGDDEIKIIRN